MTTRTILLTLHIASVAAWLGADLLVHLGAPRLARESREAALAWSRLQVWLHERYYGVVVLLILVTGVLLVLDGHWSWSAGFVWVGLAAVLLGGALGGGGLGGRARRELAAREAGDDAGAAAIVRRTVPLSLVVTALPVVAILAMVDKWQA